MYHIFKICYNDYIKFQIIYDIIFDRFSIENKKFFFESYKSYVTNYFNPSFYCKISFNIYILYIFLLFIFFISLFLYLRNIFARSSYQKKPLEFLFLYLRNAQFNYADSYDIASPRITTMKRLKNIHFKINHQIW